MEFVEIPLWHSVSDPLAKGPSGRQQAMCLAPVPARVRVAASCRHVTVPLLTGKLEYVFLILCSQDNALGAGALTRR